MKKYLKKTARIAAYLLGGFTGLVVLYGCAAWLLSRIPVNRNAATGHEQAVSIYIRTNGVHTDIVTPLYNEVKDWRQDIPFTATQSGDTAMAYLAFGWGDKGFYLQTPDWSDLKFSVAFKAMFHLGTTVMHTTFYKTMHTGASCKEIRISVEQYRKLVAYLEGSFRRDDRGKLMAIATAISVPVYGRRSIRAFFINTGNNKKRPFRKRAFRYIVCCCYTPYDLRSRITLR